MTHQRDNDTFCQHRQQIYMIPKSGVGDQLGLTKGGPKAQRGCHALRPVRFLLALIEVVREDNLQGG